MSLRSATKDTFHKSYMDKRMVIILNVTGKAQRTQNSSLYTKIMGLREGLLEKGTKDLCFNTDITTSRIWVLAFKKNLLREKFVAKTVT